MSNADMAASASSAIPPVETPFRATMALCFLVAIIEGFDIQAAGVVAPRLAPALGLGPAEMGLFFSSATPFSLAAIWALRSAMFCWGLRAG